MTAIVQSKFGGVAPRVPPRYLADHQAQIAANCPVWKGSLGAFRGTRLVTALAKAGVIQSIYKFGQDTLDETAYWFHWNHDTDVVRGAVTGDETERTFFADGVSPPKVTYSSIALTGASQAYPLIAFNLGVPAPPAAPTASVEGVVASINAETVRYAFAYYSSNTNEEGPLSREIAVEHVIGEPIAFNGLPGATASSTTVVAGDASNWWTGQLPRTGTFDSAVSGGGKTILFERNVDRVVLTDPSLTTATDTPLPAGAGGRFKHSAYGNGRFVAVASDSAKGLSSQDGTNWTAATTPFASGCRGIAFANGVFVAISNDGRVAVSNDGISWSIIQNQITSGAETVVPYQSRDWVSVRAVDVRTYGNVSGYTLKTHIILYASDGTIGFLVAATVVISSGFPTGATSVSATGGGTFVLARGDGSLVVIRDIVLVLTPRSLRSFSFALTATVTTVSAPAGAPTTLLWDGDNFLAVPASGNTLHTSTDLASWTARTLPANYTIALALSLSTNLTVLLTTELPTGATALRLYHQRPGSSTWYLVGSVAPGTGSMTDADPAQTTGGQPDATPDARMATPNVSNVVATTAAVPPAPDIGVGESRVYIYTWVSHLDEESAPSPASNLVTLYPTLQSVRLTGLDLPQSSLNNITRKRIYRSVTGSGATNFLFVGEVTAATTEFHDTVRAEALGEECPSLEWDAPPATLRGLVSLPSGSMAGFVGQDVFFCEPFRPHAWPRKYVQTVDYPIVGLGVLDTTLVVLTTGVPYFMQGAHPDSVAVVKSDILQSCTSKRSIVSFGGAVLYASPDGLMAITPTGSRNVTHDLFLREQWQGLAPQSIHAYQWEGKYVAFYDNGVSLGGFIFDPASGEIVTHDIYATAGYSDLRTDKLYLAIDNNIHAWDAGELLTYVWRSKKFTMPVPVALTWAKVEAESYPVLFRVYAEGVLLHEQMVAGRKPFRLPMQRARDYEYELEGRNEVFVVGIADSVTGLAHG